MKNKDYIKLIMKSMRNRIENRGGFLNDLKVQTKESRKNVSIEKLKEELEEIEIDVFQRKSEFDADEIQEFEAIKDVLKQLIAKK